MTFGVKKCDKSFKLNVKKGLSINDFVYKYNLGFINHSY